MRKLAIFTLLMLFGTATFAADSLHADREGIPALQYYQSSESLEKSRSKARNRRLKRKKSDQDLVGDLERGSSLVIASPTIEKGARVREININVITRDITFIAR